MCKCTKVKGMYTNTRSLRNKMEGLELQIHEEDIVYVEISETWSESSHDWLVIVQGYSLYWRDREGMCFYVKSDLMVNMRDDIAIGAGEEVGSLWLELQSGETVD